MAGISLKFIICISRGAEKIMQGFFVTYAEMGDSTFEEILMLLANVTGIDSVSGKKLSH